jgi:16S rRNA (guanine966-N2)-methyltransferase
MQTSSNAGVTRRGNVRVIGGEWRGRRIPIVDGTGVRPSPDRVRETLFNWLREMIVGARCLDLYAGTGVLGFEALSRGAAHTTFVERDAKLVAALGAQAAAFGATPGIVRRDVAAFLANPTAERYGVVFLDPPYSEPLEPLVERLTPWLSADALVYVERPRQPGLPIVAGTKIVKRGHAAAVEYGLIRFAATT